MVARRIALNPNTNAHRPTKKSSQFALESRRDRSGKVHWKRPPSDRAALREEPAKELRGIKD